MHATSLPSAHATSLPFAPVKRWAPRLYTVAAIVLLALPSVPLKSLFFYAVGFYPSSSVRASDPVEVGSSAHIRVLAPEGYLSPDQVSRFIGELEAQRTRVMQYYGLPQDNARVTFLVRGQRGQSRAPGLGWVLLYGFDTSTALHEMTHVLTGGPRWLSEGVAVLAQNRFSLGLPIDSPLYFYQRTGHRLAALEEMYRYGRLDNVFNPIAGMVRYQEAASFCQYLIDTYGNDVFMQNFRDVNFTRFYGRSVEELEQDWLAALRLGHLAQGRRMALAGVLVWIAMHLALSRGEAWRVAAAAGWLAFLAWSLYFFYVILPFALLVAFFIGGLAARRDPRLGLAALWVMAMASLVLIALVPPLAAFVRA